MRVACFLESGSGGERASMTLFLVDVLEDEADLEELRDRLLLSGREVRQVRSEACSGRAIEDSLHLRRRPGRARCHRLTRESGHREHTTGQDDNRLPHYVELRR